MTAQFVGRVSGIRVVFDGQSLNLLPGDAGNGFPVTLMSGLMAPKSNPSVGSTAWDLLNTTAVQRGLDLLPARSAYTVLVMNGGTTDIQTELDSGATLLADSKTYADARRAAGYDFIICLTLCRASNWPRAKVASSSNNVNTSTFNGAQNLIAQEDLQNNGFGAGAGTIYVDTGGTQATITYAGTSSMTFQQCTTTAGGGVLSTGGLISGPLDKARRDFNTLLMADTSGKFDAMVDVAAFFDANDYENTIYFSDGVHWNASGAAQAAALVLPSLHTAFANYQAAA